MKALKHVGGILLGAVGVLFILGTLAAMFDRGSGTPLGMNLLLFAGLGLAPLAGAFLLLRPSVTAVREARCPQCGGNQHEMAGLLRSLQGSRLMSFFGGFLASLWGASRERQVRCIQCDTLYFTETKGSRVAGTLLWIFLLMLLLAEILQQFAE